MRSLNIVGVVTALLLTGACDDMPTGGSSADNPQPNASAATAASASPSSPGVADQALLPLARAFVDAAHAYSAGCWVHDGYWEQSGNYDRCWPVGACPLVFKINDIPCGFPPDSRKGISTTVKQLIAGTKGKTLSAEAQIFVRHAEMFAKFVAGSDPLPECLARTGGEPENSTECWHTTQGTTAYYQFIIKAWNAWQAKDRRDVLPNPRFVVIAGGITMPFSKKRIAEGLRWGKCADGLCAHGIDDRD